MNASKLRLKYCMGSILLAATAANAATAAEEKGGTTALEEIVVTAQKRSESLQEVPIAVTALTAETRDLVGIQSIQDMTKFTPGVTYYSSLDRMFVRGIGRTTNNLSIDPSVATYRDGFYSSFNKVAESSSLFIKQVEILRGPQGTLYGRNSIGGALNLTSVRPTNEFEGEGRLDLGSYQEKSIEATVGGPITDWLRYRLIAGSYRQDAGFFQSTHGHANDGFGLRDNLEFEGQLAANVGDAVDIWFKFNHREWDEGNGSAVTRSDYVTFNTIAACPLRNPITGVVSATTASIVCTGSLGPNVLFNAGTGLNNSSPQYTTSKPGVLDPFKLNNDTPNHDLLKNDHTYVLEVVGHLSGADLKYTGGYSEYLYDQISDFDTADRQSFVYTPVTPAPAGQPVTIFAQINSHYIEQKHYYSNELNLISTTDSALKYVIGIYEYHERQRQPNFIGTDGKQTQFINPIGGPANPSANPYYVNQYTMTQSEAAFAQLDWNITSALRWTTGLRYSQDRKSSLDSAREIFWDPTLLGANNPAFDISSSLGTSSAVRPVLSPTGDGTYQRLLETQSHAITGTLGFEWKPMQDTMGYFTYSRGYKDSGLNSGQGLVTNPYTNPEFVDAFEIGWKQTIAQRFEMNSSAFYYKYDGAQYPLTLIPAVGGAGGGLAQTAFFNIDERIYGIEFESHWKPIDDLTLWIDYAYLHATFNDSRPFFDAIQNGAVSLDGNTVPGTPKNKASFNALYTLHFSPGALVLSGSYSWRDKSASSAFGEPGFVTPSYGTVDARVTWTDTGNHYSVIGYVRNATDKLAFDFVTIASTASGISTTQGILSPRQFGVQFQYRFGGAAGGK